MTVNARTWSPIGPACALFFPCTFMATPPPRVVCMVPETTGGHHRCERTYLHSCARVTPASAVMTPVVGSNALIPCNWSSTITAPS